MDARLESFADILERRRTTLTVHAELPDDMTPADVLSAENAPDEIRHIEGRKYKLVWNDATLAPATAAEEGP